MSKIFSFMAKLNFIIYFLIGVSLSFAILYNHVYTEVSLFLKEWGSFIVTSYMAVIAIEKIAMYNFYGRGQTIRKEIHDSQYLFVFSDLYFPKKISSGINGYKKAAGYIYVIFRVFNITMLGILIGVPTFYRLMSTYA